MVNSWSTLLVSILVPTSVAMFFRRLVNKISCWHSMLDGFLIWIGYIFLTTEKFVIDDNAMDIFYQAGCLGFLSSLLMYLLQ